jgi:hypothetical protein
MKYIRPCLDCGGKGTFQSYPSRINKVYSILFCSILFYSILFYSTLFYSILFSSILPYSILFYPILFYSILFSSIIPYSILSYSILLYAILFYSIYFRYKRIFSIGSQGITTYNPTNLDVTNRWSYADILDVKFIPSQPDFFTLFFVKENSRKDGMKFSTEHRARLMIDVMRQKFASMGRSADNVVVSS